jgi:putative ABC transport system permease protein
MTAVISGTLAIAIGLSVATFGVLYAVRFKPLPFAEPDRIVAVWLATPLDNQMAMYSATARMLRDESGVFGPIAWSTGASPQLTGEGEAEELRGASVSASFFDVFGVQPRLGRTFRSGEDEAGASHVAVLGDRVWRRRADPTIVGRNVRLDGESYEVIGVMPASFHTPADADIWLPHVVDAGERSHSGPGWYDVVARLRPGIAREVAEQRVNTIMPGMRFDPGTPGPLHVELQPFNDVETGPFHQELLLLFGAVILVLLIACANTGALRLARGLQRVSARTAADWSRSSSAKGSS